MQGLPTFDNAYHVAVSASITTSHAQEKKGWKMFMFNQKKLAIFPHMIST